MLTEKMIDKINAQINMEQFSSNLYLQMSGWCEWKGYVGCAAFLRQHATEELTHMYKLFDYLLQTGTLAKVGAISEPQADFKSLKDVFTQTLEHEKLITRTINDLINEAFLQKDFASFQFLQWFAAEQHEEENLFQGILDKMAILGDEGRSLFFLDQEVAKMVNKQTSESATDTTQA